MKYIKAGILYAITFILAISCSSHTDKPALKNGRVTIIYSGNIGGIPDPCGCRPPMGGLAKRATVINEIRNETSGILILDSGAMLYPSNNTIPPYDFAVRLTAHIMSDVMNEIGIDAVNVSSYDLADGPDTLLTYDKAPVSWLSSNILWRNSEKLVFRPDSVFTVKNLRVGVFGIITQKSLSVDIFREDAPVYVSDPVEAARHEVSKLKKESDLIVALAYMNFPQVKDLASEVPGINVIINSHTLEHRPSSEYFHFRPEIVNNAILVRCPDGGRVVGRLDLEILNGSTEFVEMKVPVSYKKESGEEITSEKSNFYNTFINLGPEIKRFPGIQEKIDLVENRVRAYKDSLAKALK